MTGIVYVDPVPEVPDPPACDLAESCLGCPLPTCRYDDPPPLNRHSEAAALGARIWAEGWSVAEAAAALGVSERTVFRYLRRANESTRHEGTLAP